MHPELKEHKLKYLLSVLGLEGNNSHLADDDVNATRNVVIHCYDIAKTKIEEQNKFLKDSRVRQRVDTLRRNYSEMYRDAIGRLYESEKGKVKSEKGKEKSEKLEESEKGKEKSEKSDCCEGGVVVRGALVDELKRFYDYLLDGGLIVEIDGLRFVLAYLSGDMIDADKEPSLYEQLCNHTMEISTLKEADLCGSSNINEHIFVTTIHKAKGLEFDNVIVFDAVDGRIPNYYSRNNPRQLAEDARKFYVALSRAKERLYVAQCIQRFDYHNMPHDVHLTPLMRSIAKYFKEERFGN